MKTIGLIGGMSWESSLEYYRLINQSVKAHLGGLHSAQSLMVSVDFEEIEKYQHAGEWNRAADIMIDAALRLQQGRADFMLICTNTMHKLASQVQSAVNLPLLHIADATAAAIQKAGIQTVGLLGTRFTMEEDFYRGRLVDRHGLSVLIPSEVQRMIVHQVIYGELCLGKINPDSRVQYREIIQDLVEQGAQGVILGCTEIGLLIKQTDSPVPVFDTTQIHAETAVQIALGLDNEKLLL